MEKYRLMMKGLQEHYGKWALITGASSGIGECFAATLASKGLNLVLIAHNEDRLRGVAGNLSMEHGITCRVIATDLTEESAVEMITHQTSDLEIGLLINCAGYALTGSFLENTAEVQLRLNKINSSVPMLLCHSFGKKMVVRGKGGIINVSSVSGMMPLPGWAVYAASKAFLLSFSQALWHELKPSGVDVLALCPGATKTSFHLKSGIRQAGLNPATVVQTALKDLGRKPSVVVGSSNKFIAFLMLLIPLKTRIAMGAGAIRKMRRAPNESQMYQVTNRQLPRGGEGPM